MTFFKFARFASWSTCYRLEDKLFSYDIDIEGDNLKQYVPSQKQNVIGKACGTTVTFKDINTNITRTYVEEKIIPYLKAEFAWLLEVKPDSRILVNGEKLDYKSLIGEKEKCIFEVFDSAHTKRTFDAIFIQWNKMKTDEYSKFYFLNSKYQLRFCKTTRLNNKGDKFYHSLIIANDFFDDVKIFDDVETELESNTLFVEDDNNKLFKELEKKLNEFLAEKRRPFLKKQANMIIKNFEKNHVMPKFSDNSWDLLRKKNFVDFVKSLYEVRPSMFVKLSIDQQRIFLELLNLVIDSNERNCLFDILDSILDLSSDDRKEFSNILKTTRLKQILSTISLIKDRILVIENLRKVLFDHSLKAGEVKHLQQIIVNHYWIFGEEYNLVCAEEVKFTQALEKYRYLLLGVEEKELITHPDKYKEMDLFLTGQDFQYGSPHNLVVEIKNPTRVNKLSYKEFGQIQKYGNVITSLDAFNDHRERWSFILIGQDIDSQMADSVIKNKESGWAYTKDNASYYVKTWAQVINDVEFRHKFLLDKLQLQRKNLSESTSLDGIMNDINNNHAAYKQDEN